jgi:hypothetical protein
MDLSKTVGPFLEPLMNLNRLYLEPNDRILVHPHLLVWFTGEQ